MGMFEKGPTRTITDQNGPDPSDEGQAITVEDDRKFRPTRNKAAKKRKRKIAKASQRRNRSK
jgi:hypothetical protein